ncbi:hypothetical protein ES703_99120 [subsurface metagenome]
MMTPGEMVDEAAVTIMATLCLHLGSGGLSTYTLNTPPVAPQYLPAQTAILRLQVVLLLIIVL